MDGLILSNFAGIWVRKVTNWESLLGSQAAVAGWFLFWGYHEYGQWSINQGVT